MQLPKSLGVFIRNYGKLKDFAISVIAGLFSGTITGIFFNSITDITFNGWINLNSYEAVAAIIYAIFAYILIKVFYPFGKSLTIIIDKKKTLSFHLNFYAGMYSSTITFLFVLYLNRIKMLITITGIGMILLFILAYYIIKKKY